MQFRGLIILRSLLVLFIAANSHWALAGKSYFQPPPTCDNNQSVKEISRGSVPLSHLSARIHDQGGTPSCGIHAGMVLIEALYYSQKDFSPNGFQKLLSYFCPSLTRPSGLSVLDAMLNHSGCTEPESKDDSASLNYQSNGVPFLLSIRKPLEVAPVFEKSVDDVNATNRALSKVYEKCKAGVCGRDDHVKCMENMASTSMLRPYCSMVKDWREVVSKIDPKQPLKALTEKNRENKVPIPPFNITTWDEFNNKKNLRGAIIRRFTSHTPRQPLLFSTCYEESGQHNLCTSRHAMSLIGLKKKTCKSPDGTTQEYDIGVFKNSWGNAEQELDLNLLIEGMHRHRLSFAEIEGCGGPSQPACLDPPIQVHNGGDPLTHLLRVGDAQAIEKILPQIDDPNKPRRWASIVPVSPMQGAVMAGSTALVKALLTDPRVDPNETFQDGRSLMEEAFDKKQTDVALELLKNQRFDPTRRFKNGESLLESSMNRSTPVALAVIENPHIDINFKFRNGESPLEYALHSNSEVALALINGNRLSLDQDTLGKIYSTYLASAVSTGSLELVRTILNHERTEFRHSKSAFQSPFYQAARTQSAEMLVTLIEGYRHKNGQAIDLNQEYEFVFEKEGLIEAAIRDNSVEKVKILVQNGADPRGAAIDALLNQQKAGASQDKKAILEQIEEVLHDARQKQGHR